MISHNIYLFKHVWVYMSGLKYRKSPVNKVTLVVVVFACGRGNSGHCLTYQQIAGLSADGQLVIYAHACILCQTASLPTPVNWLL